jgi:hypothetical protein
MSGKIGCPFLNIGFMVLFENILTYALNISASA